MRVAAALSLSLLLSLMTACDRAVYVGRDEPLALRESTDSGADAPAEEQAPPDAGMVAQPPPSVSAPSIAMTAPCDAQHLDCDGNLSNGCETDVTRNRDHCGSCGARCETADCSCDNGKLTLHCSAGRGDCDTLMNNGCETDLTTSMQHCGACQRTCHTNGHDVTSAECTASRCKVTCAPRISPEEDCDGNPDNGCETYLMFDAQHCGQCGNACAGTACEAGVCMN
jgi:hypothetical protein